MLFALFKAEMESYTVTIPNEICLKREIDKDDLFHHTIDQFLQLSRRSLLFLIRKKGKKSLLQRKSLWQLVGTVLV